MADVALERARREERQRRWADVSTLVCPNHWVGSHKPYHIHVCTQPAGHAATVRGHPSEWCRCACGQDSLRCDA